MRKSAYLFFILFLFTRLNTFAQIVATPTTGCAPLVGVNFTGITGSSNILWNFGDGSTATILNPTHTFATSGTYTVTYAATVSGSPVNQNLTITVHGKPVPSFTATPPTKGCIPLAVTFHDNSTGGGGTAITNWQWSFGDGGINSTNSANQTYTYSVGGQFNVTIKVTDANGCDSSLTIPNLINVSQKPTIVFGSNPSPPSACAPPLTVTFTSNGSVSHSTTNSTLTYFWNFGTSTSTLANPPVQTYTANGTYPVKFVVTDNNNCSDSVIKQVIIQNPFASFLTNDTVCMQAAFQSNSTGGSVYNWNFGDGGTGIGVVGTHTYTAPGHYQVKLTVVNGNCQDDTTISVYVEQPIANFTIAPTYMCSLPKTISLTNLSSPTGGAMYQWGFFENYSQYVFNPINSTQTNPTFTISSYLDTNRYTIHTFDYQDSINLTITTPRGCKARVSINFADSIYLPTARFMPDKYQGCVPLTVHFYDSSRSKEPINYWEYDFDDGSPHSIGVQNPVHTYTSTGVYYPTLIIHNTNGCLDTSFAIKIEVGKMPNANFSVAPTNICIGDAVTFTNLTPASDSVDMWHYYGDGGFYSSGCYNTPNSSWPFTHATGPQTISLVACFRGCCDTATQVGAVNVKGPLATFSTAMDCDSPMVYTFTGTISDAVNWTWDFGDGNTVPGSTASVISHSYSTTGDYWVYLTAFNAGTGCNPSKDSVKIHVRNIKADFIFDTLLCSKVPYNFDGSISQDVYSFGNNGYTWFWGDGTHPDITAGTITSHSFSPAGIYTVTLVVKDINGCPDTVRKKIRAFWAQASFTSQATMCINDTVVFTSTSTADTTITNYNWIFGDGTFSNAQTPSHIFNITNATIQKDSVWLIITTALGCVDTVKKIITISRPSALFNSITPVNICAGDSVKFNKTVIYPGMLWNFGDGSTLNGNNQPVHHYNNAGSFSVTLTVVDSIGCTDAKSNVVVNVQNIPQVYITSPAFQTKDLCYPYQATFADSSVANIYAYHFWNLGTGQTVNNSLQTVGTIYQTPGTYTISLIVYTTNGCKDSLKRTITVLGPVADFTLSPSAICKGQSISFNIKDTTDVFTWHWDFGDGKDTTARSPIAHTYNFHPPGGSTNVTLVYWSQDSTCVQTKVYPINIYQVVSDFHRNNEITVSDTAHCLGITDVFNNISTNADTWGWTFGDGGSSGAFSPSHQYAAPGTYNVELFIKNNTTGCVDTLIKKMVIYPPIVASANGDSICQGQSGQIHSSGGTIYAWAHPAGLNDTTLANPTANPTVTTTYTVIVTDANGCKDTTTTIVYVQQPAQTRDTLYTMVIGQTCTLNGNAGIGFTYTWTPTTSLSCDHCPTPVCNSTVDISYVETIGDVMGCFSAMSTFTVHIEPLSSVDVPSAFTPNGDGINDVVYVAGWGIKRLIYFKIFNRWGELIFETDDIKIGWDGTYMSVPQNTETYVYEVSVEPYIDNGKPVVKKGAVKLLR